MDEQAGYFLRLIRCLHQSLPRRFLTAAYLFWKIDQSRREGQRLRVQRCDVRKGNRLCVLPAMAARRALQNSPQFRRLLDQILQGARGPVAAGTGRLQNASPDTAQTDDTDNE